MACQNFIRSGCDNLILDIKSQITKIDIQENKKMTPFKTDVRGIMTRLDGILNENRDNQTLQQLSQFYNSLFEFKENLPNVSQETKKNKTL